MHATRAVKRPQAPCSETCIYIEEDDMSEASASLHLLKFAAQHIKDLQVPDLKNIF